MHCSRRRLLRRRLEVHVCTINKSAHTKKSADFFNDPRMYLSQFILDVSVVCERSVETGIDWYIDPTFLLTVARCVIFKNPLSTSSASWLVLLNQGSLRATASVCKLVLTLAFLSSTNTTAAGTCLYSFMTYTFFCFFFHLFKQVHLWLTARSRVSI